MAQPKDPGGRQQQPQQQEQRRPVPAAGGGPTTTSMPKVNPGAPPPGVRLPPGVKAAPKAKPPPPKPAMTAIQKQQLGSNFNDMRKARERSTLLGSTAGVAPTESLEETTNTTELFDGRVAPTSLQGRDLWRAVQPRVQSREGRRSRELLEQVLNQFAVGSNPRYQDDGPGRTRAHIFVWDVSRAMGCEVPHFAGAKELSLGQTCDWLHLEGPMRGWRRISEQDVMAAVDAGQLVLAFPREQRMKQLAVVPPQTQRADGAVLLCGACLKRGTRLTSVEALGVRAVEFMTHA